MHGYTRTACTWYTYTHLYTYKNYHELLAIECERVCQRMRVTNKKISDQVSHWLRLSSTLSHMVMGQNPGTRNTRMAPKVIAGFWMIIPNVISIAFDPSPCRNESRHFPKPRSKPPVSYCVYDLMSPQVFDKIVILYIIKYYIDFGANQRERPSEACLKHCFHFTSLLTLEKETNLSSVIFHTNSQKSQWMWGVKTRFPLGTIVAPWSRQGTYWQLPLSSKRRPSRSSRATCESWKCWCLPIHSKGHAYNSVSVHALVHYICIYIYVYATICICIYIYILYIIF